MTLTNAPAVITQLATQLVACAGWTPGLTGCWYPSSPAIQSGTHAVLCENDYSGDVYAEGALPLPSGDLRILLYVDDTIGNAEALGRTLCNQLLAQFNGGLAFRSAKTGLSSDPSSDRIAAGNTKQILPIDISYGLRA